MTNQPSFTCYQCRQQTYEPAYFCSSCHYGLCYQCSKNHTCSLSQLLADIHTRMESVTEQEVLEALAEE